MDKQKMTVYGIILLGGFTLSWVVNRFLMNGGTPPPPLSAIPPHMAFIDESTCLQCHVEKRAMRIQEKEYVTPIIPHEPRRDCVSCHVLPT